jgi:GNAT superfamily N-acetyltransferase
MRTYIRSKPIDRLTEQETRECRRLTMGSIGEMQKLLDREQRICKGPLRSILDTYQTGRAVMLREQDSGKLLGWALVVYCSGEPSAHFYVLKECRRRGIGSRLYSHVQRFGRDPYCFPPGRRSRAFFRAVGAPNAE